MQISVCVTVVLLSVAYTALLTADQLAYLPYASLSAAPPTPPNIWLPQCRFVSPTLFHCLNSVLICSPLFRTPQFLFQNPLSFLIYQCPSDLYHLKVRANLKHGTFLLPYLVFVQQCDL